MRKMFVVMCVLVFALIGCQANKNNDTTTRDGKNTTYEQTRYKDDNVTHNERFSEMRNRDDRINRENDRDNKDYRVSKEAAERITEEVDEIDNAYVLTTRHNAYVAATLKDRDDRDNRDDDNGQTRNMSDQRNHDDDITDEVKRKVSDIVQSVDGNIDNVYVTTSPDFINLSEQYANDLDEGRPVRGFFDQIGNAIERIFPQERTTDR